MIAADYSLRGVGACHCGKCAPKKRAGKQSMYMFYASVLVGQYTCCNSSDRRPPKNKKTGRLFDSTTGYLSGDEQEIYKCYVIFDAMQHYPEYIIEFGKFCQKEKSDESASPAKTTNAKPTKKKTKKGKVAVADGSASPDDNTKQDNNNASNR